MAELGGGLTSLTFQFSCSAVSDSATPRTAAHQASLSFTISWSLLKLMSIKLVMPSNHLILRCLLLLPPSIFPKLRVFSSESILHIKWSKYCSFSFSSSPSNEYSGLISFRIDWLDHSIWSHHFMTNRWGSKGNSVRLFWGGASKITADGDRSHKIKRHLLLGRKL